LSVHTADPDLFDHTHARHKATAWQWVQHSDAFPTATLARGLRPMSAWLEAAVQRLAVVLAPSSSRRVDPHITTTTARQTATAVPLVVDISQQQPYCAHANAHRGKTWFVNWLWPTVLATE